MTSGASAQAGGPCCSCQSRNSTCSRCICVRSGRKCTSCHDLSRGTCKNDSHDIDNKIAESVAVLVDPSPTCEESVESYVVTSNDSIDAKLTRAFGAFIL